MPYRRSIRLPLSAASCQTRVHLEALWLPIALLLVWTLAARLFPSLYATWPAPLHWLAGIEAAVGTFLSLVVREMARAWIAGHLGAPPHDVTLLPFGGIPDRDLTEDAIAGSDVAGTDFAEGAASRAASRAEETQVTDATALSGLEIRVAALGPVVSGALTLAFLGLGVAGRRLDWTESQRGVLFVLAVLNLILTLLHLLPAFPLDGGRVLRALLWRWKRDRLWATRIAAGIGGTFGLALVISGILYALRGSPVAGVWWALVGILLRRAASRSLHRTALLAVLARRTVDDVMDRQATGEPASVDLATLARRRFPTLATAESAPGESASDDSGADVPIVEDGQLVGCLSAAALASVERGAWSKTRAGEIARPCAAAAILSPDAPALRALSRLECGLQGELLIVRDGRFLGIVSVAGIARHIEQQAPRRRWRRRG